MIPLSQIQQLTFPSLSLHEILKQQQHDCCLLGMVRIAPLLLLAGIFEHLHTFFTLILCKGVKAKLWISMGARTEWCLLELGGVHVFALMFSIKGTCLAM